MSPVVRNTLMLSSVFFIGCFEGIGKKKFKEDIINFFFFLEERSLLDQCCFRYRTKFCCNLLQKYCFVTHLANGRKVYLLT
ncbi:hypothetical protein NPIL_463241 [Nephila pilipes]|uniref:Uncharacterized protein n=1 Tax=Nephila pilipes TaxID=299642 RepID=A0A8X6NP63_NEPPI|nr:hypothetical protein NPIL_463241 [Nephila pilipes]